MAGLDVLRRQLSFVTCPKELAYLRDRSRQSFPGDAVRDAIFEVRAFEIKLASVASVPELDAFEAGLAADVRDALRPVLLGQRNALLARAERRRA